MGFSDTILLDPAITCPNCGRTLELQTRHFEPAMLSYRIGSVISGSPVLSGILTENLFCHDCHKAERGHRVDVWLVVWHSILAGVERSEQAAEARLASVDRLDLVRWLDEAQRAERTWRSRFRSLHGDVSKWHEHLEHPEPDDNEGDESERSRRRAFRALLSLPKEILDAPDPLAEILAKHKDTSKESDGMFW